MDHDFARHQTRCAAQLARKQPLNSCTSGHSPFSSLRMCFIVCLCIGTRVKALLGLLSLCSSAVSACPGNCSNSGTCMGSYCDCLPNYARDDCSTALFGSAHTGYETVRYTIIVSSLATFILAVVRSAAIIPEKLQNSRRSLFFDPQMQVMGCICLSAAFMGLSWVSHTLCVSIGPAHFASFAVGLFSAGRHLPHAQPANSGRYLGH